MNLSLHSYQGSRDELWKQKRFLMFELTEGGEAAKRAAEGLSEKETEQDLAQKRIEEHIGISQKEANDTMTYSLDLHNGKLKSLIDQWNVNEWMEASVDRAVKFATVGFIDSSNKGRLSNRLTEVAKTEARRSIQLITNNNTEIVAYAENAVNVLGYKLEACGRLKTNLQEEIDMLKGRRDRYQQAGQKIDRFQQLGVRLENLFDFQNYDRRIALLERIQATTETVRAETQAEIDEKSDNNKVIEGWESDLRALTTPHLKGQEPEVYEAFETALTEGVLNGNKTPFHQFIQRYVPERQDRAMINALFMQLTNGNTAGNFLSSEGRIGKYYGAITAEDVRNYWRHRTISMVRANQNESLKERVQFLDQCRPGHRLQIGKDKIYIIVRRDAGEGYLLKERGKDNTSYFDARDPEKPTLTTESRTEVTEDGEKKTKITFEKKEIVSAGKTTSTDSVDFDFKGGDGEKTERTVRGTAGGSGGAEATPETTQAVGQQLKTAFAEFTGELELQKASSN